MPYNWNNYNSPRKSGRNERPDHQKGHRAEFERNRKRIIATQEICALCGQPVDKSLKYPHPMCATVDHIIPVSKGGHPSALENLQLAHFTCNRMKWDRLQDELKEERQKATGAAPSMKGPRGLPLSIDWGALKLGDSDNLEALWKEAEALRAKGLMLTARGIIPARE